MILAAILAACAVAALIFYAALVLGDRCDDCPPKGERL